MSNPAIRQPRFVNLQAANAAPFWRAVAGWLGAATKRPIAVVEEGHWTAWRDLFALGEADLATACGSYYVAWAGQRPPVASLVAAPVMAAPHYEGRPVYFSEVLVRADSPFEAFEDLAGARWAFNEPGSFSGHLVIRHELARRGWGKGFLGSMVESGSHETSLALIAAGAVDVAAIDGVVWEAELRARPRRAEGFRLLARWGPYPIPPVLASARVSPAWRERYAETLLAMHRDPAGRKILADAGVARFAAVQDADYDVLRQVEAPC